MTDHQKNKKASPWKSAQLGLAILAGLLIYAYGFQITKVDLDGPSLGQFNPVEGGVIFNESEITITDAPGLGIREIRGLELLPG